MINSIVKRYLDLFPADKERLAPLLAQLTANESLNDRKNFTGHITGSALILSPDRQKILVVYHKLFHKWLQPGGHWEADEIGPWAAAAREASEETSVQVAHQIAWADDERVPLEIGVHPIKNRPQKHEPSHLHYDFRYPFVAASEQLRPRKKEVNILEIKWMPLDDPRLSDIAMSVTRLRQLALGQS